jgi:hypothetical protein
MNSDLIRWISLECLNETKRLAVAGWVPAELIPHTGITVECGKGARQHGQLPGLAKL